MNKTIGSEVEDTRFYHFGASGASNILFKSNMKSVDSKNGFKRCSSIYLKHFKNFK